MRNSMFKSEDLGNLGNFYSGIRTSYLRQDNNTGDIKVRILNWKNLKEMQNNKTISPVTEFKLNSQKLDKRGYGIIEEDTIIFSALPSLNLENIIYVDKNLGENNICGDNMYIFKNESNIPTKYIYTILNSGIYNDYLNHLKIKCNNRIGIKMLERIEIPILENLEKITEEYFKIQNEKKKILNKEDEFCSNLHQQAIHTLMYS